MPLTKTEIVVLSSMLTYGRGVDWGGAEARSNWRNAAKALIARGLLGGSYRNSHLTKAGRKAIETHQKAHGAAAFSEDRQQFEGRR